MALVTGWMAAVLVVIAATFPLAFRLQHGKRAAPASKTIGTHVVLGLGTSAIGFLHTATVVTALGSPGAVAGGATALGAGAFAFFVLMAHTGVGLQLRNEKLKDRPKKRSLHRITAATIVVAIALHVILLRR